MPSRKWCGASWNGQPARKKNLRRFEAEELRSLDLNRLNLKAPYAVWEAGKQTYGFKTDFGVLFRTVFIDDQTIWENGAYEFAIINENHKPSPNDGKVKDTILAIIEEFFACNPRHPFVPM